MLEAAASLSLSLSQPGQSVAAAISLNSCPPCARFLCARCSMGVGRRAILIGSRSEYPLRLADHCSDSQSALTKLWLTTPTLSASTYEPAAASMHLSFASLGSFGLLQQTVSEEENPCDCSEAQVALERSH